MSKNTYETRKRNGICVVCGKKEATECFVTCESCREKQRIEIRKTREYLKKLGLCPRCGKEKLFGSEKNCISCRMKMLESNRKRAEQRRIEQREYYKKDIQRLKDNGICRGCRKKPVVMGKTYCKHCAEVRRLKRLEGTIPRSERYYYGLCYRCGEKLDTDKRLCSKCCEISSNNLPVVHTRNEYWEKENKIAFSKL